MAAGPALADKCVALIIGNSDYRFVARLDNPANDAKLSFGAVLRRRSAFQAIALLDHGGVQMPRLFTSELGLSPEGCWRIGCRC